MQIRHKLHIVTAITFGVFLLVSFTLLTASRQIGRAWQQDNVANELVRGLFELGILTTDYVLHDGERARVQWEQKFNSLTRLLSEASFDDPESQSTLQRIRQDHQDIRKVFAGLVEAEALRDQHPENTTATFELKQRFVGQLDARTQTMVAAASELAEFSRRSAALKRDWATSFVLASLALIAVMVLAITWMFDRSVLKPIKKLQQGTEIIGAGVLNHKVGTLAEDEVGQLSRAFDTMTGKLNAVTVSRDELAREVAERQRTQEELRRTKEAAESANRAKSTFLANMSHEIRTPMNAIIGFSQLMHRDPALTEQQRQHLDIIYRSGEHLLALINDILEMSKIEAGRTSLNPTTFDLPALLHDIETMFKVRTDAKHLQLLLEFSDDFPQYVVADEGKLRQVLINLLGNAVKFTEEGGIALRVRVDRFSSGPLHLLIDVEDTGHGIAPEDMGRLFQTFEQAATRPASAGGTGLGLAISRQFARLMGGDITVTSELGKGSCFRVEIEIQEGSGAEAERKIPQQRVIRLEPGQGPYRVLVVDDRPENCKLLSEVLRLVGFETQEACNGKDAIARFEEWHPHVILMDMRMPVMDGYEAIRRIKATDKGAQMPIIAITASAFAEDRKKVLSTGVSGYIRKPFKEHEVFDALQHCLGCRYVYEHDAPAAQRTETDLSPAAIKEALVHVPTELHQQILKAAREADLDLLQELIDQTVTYAPQLAHHLHHLAAGFHYDTLVKCLELGKDERPSTAVTNSHS